MRVLRPLLAAFACPLAVPEVQAMSMGSRSLPPPTAEQKRRWGLMEQFGCIACHMQGRLGFGQCGEPQRHHLTVGGKHGAPRLGHDFTVMLGAWHHMGLKTGVLPVGDDYEAIFGPSYAKTPKAFRAEFGSDEYLLKYQNDLIGWTAEPQRERKRKSRTTAGKKTVTHPAKR